MEKKPLSFEESQIHTVQDQEQNAALNEDKYKAPFDLNMSAGNFISFLS